MDLTWWIVAIAGCVALAGCVGLALLWRHPEQSGGLLPLANTTRLTGLPQYRRARRRHTITAAVTMTLLALAFAAAAMTAARPTGLPSANHHQDTVQPQDIMVCIGAPVTDAAVRTTLRFFSGTIGGFGTERIGLTSANRRVVPLTRDYQYAIGEFSRYSLPPPQHDGPRPFVAPVAYTNYTESVDDLLALCMSGFPGFPAKSAQRRSLIYIAPKTCPAPDSPHLFDPDKVRDMALGADIQVNAVLSGACDNGLTALARSTGGQSHSADTDVPAQLRDISSHPPPDSSVPGGVISKSRETPDLPLLAAIVAVMVLSVWTAVARR